LQIFFKSFNICLLNIGLAVNICSRSDMYLDFFGKFRGSDLPKNAPQGTANKIHFKAAFFIADRRPKLAACKVGLRT
jgi:hypothetical protein